MDKFQSKLRLLIVTGSAVGFIGGWGLLAHSGKPVANLPVDDPSTATDYYPTVATPTPLPPIDFKALESAAGGGSSNNVQIMPSAPSAPNSQQSVPTFRPRFRTRTS